MFEIFAHAQENILSIIYRICLMHHNALLLGERNSLSTEHKRSSFFLFKNRQIIEFIVFHTSKIVKLITSFVQDRIYKYKIKKHMSSNKNHWHIITNYILIFSKLSETFFSIGLYKIKAKIWPDICLLLMPYAKL